jgi:hypothetical protein
MEKRKTTKKAKQKICKKENKDRIFQKKIEHLKEEDKKLMLKLYSEITKDMNI